MISPQRTVIVFLLMSLFTAVPPLQAFWCEDGVPVCTTVGYQHNLETAYGFAGHTLLAWDDERAQSDHDIYVQHLDEIGSPLWAVDGLALCLASGDQLFPRIINDGVDGAIIAWEDNRGADSDIYAQRVRSEGSLQWMTDGVSICNEPGDQEEVRLVTDGQGGALMAWFDYRNTDKEVYAQRIDAKGSLLWHKIGIPVCAIPGDKWCLQAVSDGFGGAIMIWSHDRGAASLTDIYVQRLDGKGTLLWAAGGVPVCTAPGNQLEVQAITDGAGGVIVTWTDNRSGIDKVYAQRVGASGTPLWTADGVLLSAGTYANFSHHLTPDGSGGVIVTWDENHHDDGGFEVYAQRVSQAGAVQWAPEGVNVSAVAGGQGLAKITGDGSGGAVIAWVDDRDGQSSLYAQKIDATGALQWRTGGTPLLLTLTGLEELQIIGDGTGGAVVAWQGYREVEVQEIYAQWVDAQGMPGYRPTVIGSISDIPGDEGGWVRLTIEKHSYDDEGWFRYPIYMYNTYRRVDEPSLIAAIEGKKSHSDQSPSQTFPDGWPMVELDDRMFLAANELLPVQYFPPGIWEVMGSFNAFRQDQYLTVAGTLADSTSMGIPMPVYCVSAHTLDPSMWYVSAPDSGYSVDNIAPTVPTGLSREAGDILTWDPSLAGDFLYFSVFGSEVAQRDGNETLVEHTTGTSTSIDGLAYSYYLVTATDRHGNESGVAVLSGVSDVPGGRVAESRLFPNQPNPFNPSTKLSFELATPGHVRLMVYDTAGRLVITLVDEQCRAGGHELFWDGRDDSGRTVSAGVYLYRLETRNHDETKRMTLVK